MGRAENRNDSSEPGSRPQTPASVLSRSPSTGAGVALLSGTSPSMWHFADYVEELGGRSVYVGMVIDHAGPLKHAVCARIERDGPCVAVLFVFPDATEAVWFFVGGYGH